LECCHIQSPLKHCSFSPAMFQAQKGMQGTPIMMRLASDETREQGIMPCPPRPARHSGMPDLSS
jgi:hypothetical protein